MLEAKRRVGSSPDNGGTDQHLQMVWVRQARRKGATKVNQWLNPLKRLPRLQTVGCGPDSSARRLGNETATPKSEYRGRRGGHEESLRRTRGEAAGEELGTNPVDRCMVNVGTTSGSPNPSHNRCVGGQARCRLRVLRWDGGSVVVRAWESHVHGEGTQRVSSNARAMAGGRR